MEYGNTKQRRDNHGTPFGTWLRQNHQDEIGSYVLSIQNLDYICHNYRDSWLITIEEKRYRRSPEPAQQDTHNVVAQMLAIASGSVVKTRRGLRRVEYRGHYVVVFEKTTPEDGWVNINGIRSSEAELVKLLKTGRLETKTKKLTKSE